MRKLTLLALLFISITSMAQVRVGLTGAGQLVNLIISDGDGSEQADSKIGFQAGLMLDAPIADKLSIRPQLLYSTKGTKESTSVRGVGTIESTLTFNYIEIPIQLVYGIEAGPGHVLLGFGPYLGYALNGNASTKGGGFSESEPIEFGSGADQVKRIDYGLRLSAGYEMSNISLSAYYSPGLANLVNSNIDGSIKNTAFGLSLGLLFGSKQ